jgi:hypothetical protein
VIKAIINGLLKLIMSILNVFLLPINALFENLFPDMSSSISTFNNFVNSYVGGTLSYFFSILPPIFRGLLVIWFTFLISYYTIYFTYHTLIKIWGIIQKIKFW